MALLTTQQIGLLGLINPSYVAAGAGGDQAPNPEGMVLHVRNGGGSPVTVTLDDQRTSTPPGAVAFDPNVAVVIPAGENAFIGNLSQERFTKLVDIAYSGVTSVTVAALVAP